MPQMMPLNWTTMMILFSMTFMMFFILNYFTKENFMDKKIMQSKKQSMNWKW